MPRFHLSARDRKTELLVVAREGGFIYVLHYSGSCSINTEIYPLVFGLCDNLEFHEWTFWKQECPPILNVAQCVENGNFQLAAFHHADYFKGSGLLIWLFKFCSQFMTLFPLWKWLLNRSSPRIGFSDGWMAASLCVGIIGRNWCDLFLYFNIQMSHGQDKNISVC